MWTFKQSTGEFFSGATLICTGYAGKNSGKNNPKMQAVSCIGPLPQGFYSIGDPYDSKLNGPFVLRLTPDEGNIMFGRGGFLIHGDSIKAPGTASCGCIILPRPVREKIAASKDRGLQVEA